MILDVGDVLFDSPAVTTRLLINLKNWLKNLPKWNYWENYINIIDWYLPGYLYN